MSAASSARCSVFDRTVVAVDGSPGSLEAARQADALRHALGMIELVGVYTIPAGMLSADAAAFMIADAERSFAERFEAGRAVCPTARAEILHGPLVGRLLERVADSHATLVAVGASAHNRPVGVLLGSVPTAMLHRAPCSVLVARRPWLEVSRPRSIVVGYDGSSGASMALAAGRDLVTRFDATMRVVLADAAASIESDELDGLAVERDDHDAVDVLVGAADGADMLVVGSRGLRGVKAIGSVSERLGHRAACSVLIVRDAPGR